jgi:hypothetical protein
MYSAYGLLTPATDFSLEAARERLQKKFPAASVTLANGVITLSGGDWDFQLYVNDKNEITAEHQDMAEKLGGADNNPEVSASRKRVEVWSNTNDPFLEHFNDYLQIIEVLQTFRGLIAIDPKEPAFM